MAPLDVSPLQTQYINQQGLATLRPNAAVNPNSGTMDVPSIWTNAGATGTATDAGTTGAGGQVQREYAALMAAFQNPTGGQDQLRQVLSQFQPAQTAPTGDNGAAVVPSIPMWAVLGAQHPLSGGDTAAYYAKLANQQAVALATRDAAPAQGDPTQPQQGDPTLQGDPTQQGDPTALANPTDAPTNNAPAQPNDLLSMAQNSFISQNRSQWNQKAQDGNLDCGPTSLAMALRMLGKINQPVDGSNSEDLIDQVRQLMTGSTDHSQKTYKEQLESAASQLGLRSQEVSGLRGIDAALAQGHPVISYGNPADAGAYGQALSADQYNQFNGDHVIVVAGKQGNNYVIDDPLSKVGALVVTPSQLQAFIADQNIGLHGGVALSRA